MPTELKRAEVAELAELIRSSEALAVADYRGLSVSDMHAVRRSLRAAGVSLRIAKNRLLKIAAAEAGRPQLTELLAGPTALASAAGDGVALAKALNEALRPYAKVVSVRGALIGETAIDAGSLQRMANLPPREVLLARLAGALASPLGGMAGVLSANLRNFIGVLSAVAEQKRQSEGGTAA